MSAPPADVVDRLEQLAAHAPRGGLDLDAVWTRGRRRQRVRLGVALAAVVAVGLLGTTTTPRLVDRAQQVEPADSGHRMVLPDVIRQPGGWEPAFGSAPGRLSAVGIGARSGLWSSRNALWGVSAATGESRFLDLPDAADVLADPALTADGGLLAYWTTGQVDGEPIVGGAVGNADHDPIVGVAVLDLETGERQVWEVRSTHGLSTGGLAWAGDVLWWSAGPVRKVGDSATSARLQLHTWDQRTGEQDEPTGSRPGLNPVGDAPGGFVEQWRARRLTRVIGGAERTTLRVLMPAGTSDEAGITQPTMSTDGSRVAALLMPDASRDDDAPKELLVGAVDGRDIVLDPLDGVREQAIAGWRSPTEVVVTSQDDVEEGRPMRALRAWSVDVTDSGRTELLSFDGNAPRVAAEAWTAEVVPAPDAPFAPDPRLVGLGLAVAALVVWRVVLLARRRRGDA